MSLPNYLAKIKSSGVYRFVWDKSIVPPQQAETLRLVVGYSEKGPFNTPVYIANASDFISIYGRGSKRLERRGCFFHRMALQALGAGPILALNLKPFGEKGEEKAEQVEYILFNASMGAKPTPVKKNVVDVYDTSRFWKLDADMLDNKLISPAETQQYAVITATDTKESSCSMFIRHWDGANSAYDLTIRQYYANNPTYEMPEYLEKIADEKLSKYFGEIYVFKGAFTKELCQGDGVLSKYFDNSAVAKTSAAPAQQTKAKTTTPASTTAAEAQVKDAAYEPKLNETISNTFGEQVDALQALADDVNSNFVGVYRGCMIPYFKDGRGNYFALDLDFNRGFDNHKMLMKLSEKVLEKANIEIINDILSKQDPWATALNPIYLEGYTYNKISKSVDDATLQGNVYGVLSSKMGKGIVTALTNRVDVEYHYIIDTFRGLPGHSDYKKYLSQIAKEKDNAFAILNYPSIMELNETTSAPVIKDGKLDEKAVKKAFEMPMDTEGASWCAFYTPLTFSDGTVKSIVPSAALVSNNFMEKWGARKPYYIVAGPNYGVLRASGLVGPDYNYGRADLDILEPIGVNVNIYVPRRGTFINSNQTAKQMPVSALSKIHVRELVIYLQNEIENMLQNYQWELNTAALRDTIKTKADTILENIMNNGGVYAYITTCDETNNTPEVIDNEMIVLDIEIEPARGAGKMVQTLTIHKTGGITSK